MIKINNKPKIRFKGFTDEWKQRELGEIGKARSGVGFPDTEQGLTSGIPFFKVSDMNNEGNENEMTIANNYVTDTQIACRRWTPIKELPAIFFAKVGAAVMLNRKRLCRFPFLFDNNTMVYSLGKDMWNADFAKVLFETIDLTSLIQVGALPSYNTGDVEAIEVMIPKVLEQNKIGTYFKTLENLINFHQHKYEKYKNTKNALLEKMFPKSGSKIPEIRFKGFTDAWEQRELGEFATESNEKGSNGKEAKKLTVKLHTKGVYEANEKIQGSDNTQYYIRHTGQFVYGKQNFFNGAIGIIPKNLDKYESTKDVPAFDIDKTVHVEWLYQYIARPKIYKEQEVNCTGTGSKRFHVNKFLSMSALVPTIDEQIKISDFFQQLDNLITLHHRMVEKLKNIKSALLEKMFV